MAEFTHGELDQAFVEFACAKLDNPETDSREASLLESLVRGLQM